MTSPSSLPLLTQVGTLVVLSLVIALEVHQLAVAYGPQPVRMVNANLSEDVGGLSIQPAIVLDPVSCDDGRECFAGVYDNVTGTCQHYPRPPATACNSTCYVDGTTSTVCGTDSVCGHTTDMTACKGYCETAEDCAATLPYDTTWNGLNYFGARYVWRADNLCHRNRCILYVVVSQFAGAQNGFGNNFADLLMPKGCLRYLNQTVAADQHDCIVANKYVLPYNMTAALSPSNYTSDNRPLLAVCEMHYACSRMNLTYVNSTLPTQPPEWWTN